MIKELKNIIYDQEFKIIILKNKVNIINYSEILIFEENKIVIKNNKELIKVLGTNLTITKLLNKELLIEGSINTIELG